MMSNAEQARLATLAAQSLLALLQQSQTAIASKLNVERRGARFNRVGARLLTSAKTFADSLWSSRNKRGKNVLALTSAHLDSDSS